MPPLLIIFVSIPLVLGWIPRNGFYGIRVREAFASDASWYAINRLGSIALVGACLVWMAAAAYAPRQFVKPIGIAAVVLALAVLVLTQGWTI
jgi:cadmium resistance protein CadD (predicted permease)